MHPRKHWLVNLIEDLGRVVRSIVAQSGLLFTALINRTRRASTSELCGRCFLTRERGRYIAIRDSQIAIIRFDEKIFHDEHVWRVLILGGRGDERVAG